jgi:hypothetical protein
MGTKWPTDSISNWERRRTQMSELSMNTGFSNKVGSYRLLAVEGGRVHYRFTNRRGKTAEMTVSLPTWQRMQANAEWLEHPKGA